MLGLERRTVMTPKTKISAYAHHNIGDIKDLMAVAHAGWC